MSYAGQGASNKQLYDCCKYSQDISQSVNPFYYQMYFGKGENCNKCIDNKVWFKQDPQLVNVESELLNITRPLSDCSSYKYNPNQPNTSTFNPNVPIILPASLCPIVYNNIPRQTDKGYADPSMSLCNGQQLNTNYNSVKQYDNNLNVNNNNNMYSFINSCNQQPLFEGQTRQVKSYSLLDNYGKVGNN